MAENDDLVTLDLEGVPIMCSRKDLIENSDYFKAMFDGNYVESDKSVIHLKEVDPKSLKMILKLVWDKEYMLEMFDESVVLSVLHTSCMLQFLEIKELLKEQVEKMLSVNNCLKIWFFCEEIGLSEIYCKAKLVALHEFGLVKDTAQFLELNLRDLLSYIGNVNLYCTQEWLIFDGILKWWQYSEEENTESLLRLLTCLNFRNMSISDISQILACDVIKSHEKICDFLKKVIDFKNGALLNPEVAFLLKTKTRNTWGFPCLYLYKVEETKEAVEPPMVVYDRFKRKRSCTTLQPPSSNSYLSYVELASKSLKKIDDVILFPCHPYKLDGFKIQSYKNKIFLFGGEYLTGKGRGLWNNHFNTYDVMKREWLRSKVLFSRRHFESCICGKNLFVVGGTGGFRVLQEKIVWYDIEHESWSSEVDLPCSAKQIKCCSFRGDLFVLSLNDKCGYVFCVESGKWTTLEVSDWASLPSYDENMLVFSYEGFLYIFGESLLELRLENDKLRISRNITLLKAHQKTCLTHRTDSVLCNNVVYSLYKEINEDTNKLDVCLTSLNLNFHKLETSESSLKEYHIFTMDFDITSHNSSVLFHSVILFNGTHPNLFKKNELVNE